MTVLGQRQPSVLSFEARSTARCGAWAAVVALLVGALSGCGDVATGGQRVELQSWVAVEPAARNAFTTSLQWNVQLSQAHLGLGHLYYVTGEAVGGELSDARSPGQAPRNSNSVGRSSAFWSLLVAQAHAHPGHYAAGETLGEMTRAQDVDLLAPAHLLQRSEALTGTAHSAVLSFAALSAGVAQTEQRGEIAVYVEGEATQADARVWFAGAVRLSALNNSASKLPEVPGIVLSPGEISAAGRVTLQIKPSVWLDQVDFAQLLDAAGEAAEVAADARHELLPETQPHNALVRGIQKAISYELGFEPAKANRE